MILKRYSSVFLSKAVGTYIIDSVPFMSTNSINSLDRGRPIYFLADTISSVDFLVYCTRMYSSHIQVDLLIDSYFIDDYQKYSTYKNVKHLVNKII